MVRGKVLDIVLYLFTLYSGEFDFWHKIWYNINIKIEGSDE